MSGARVGRGRGRDGEDMFKWGPGVPQPCLDRMHAVVSHTPGKHTKIRTCLFFLQVSVYFSDPVRANHTHKKNKS